MRWVMQQQPCSSSLVGCRRSPPLSFFCKRTTTKQQQQVVSVRVRAAASCSNGEEGVRLTVSDSELASRGFAVRRTTEGLDVGALNEVFSRVGFPRRQEERLRLALDHSRVVWLSSSSTSTTMTAAGRPVAFARAAGDVMFNAVVWDVVVGIDRRLLLGSTVGSCWDRPSALAGIDRRL
jgi:hypothetical protein